MSMYDTEPESSNPGRLRDTPTRPDPPQCGICGTTDIRISAAGLGVFCSRACLEAAVRTQARQAG